MATNDQKVRTTTVLFSEIVQATDPTRQAEIDRGEVAYIFSGNKIKRDGKGPYANNAVESEP